jgi:TolB protein
VRADVGPLGVEADGSLIGSPSISADGTRVAFASLASNLVPGDSGEWIDVFVHDRLTGSTKRITAAADGAEGDGSSFSPAISADGRYVAFDSYAANLSLGDTNGASDVFLHDLFSGSTVRVSSTIPGGPPAGHSEFPSISSDGRYVAFESTAPDLVVHDSNGFGDVFVWDRMTGRTRRVSLNSAPAGISGQAELGSGLPSISADGSVVAFVSADANYRHDVYIRDLRHGRTTRASIGTHGQESHADASAPVLSADGRHVAFHVAWPLVPEDADWTRDVYVRDLDRKLTVLASTPAQAGADGDAPSYNPVLSADGGYVAFTSFAPLVPGDLNQVQEVYLREMVTGRLSRVAVNVAGTPASGSSYGAAITADARTIAFGSSAANLVPFDNNHADDVFVSPIHLAIPDMADAAQGARSLELFKSLS